METTPNTQQTVECKCTKMYRNALHSGQYRIKFDPNRRAYEMDENRSIHFILYTNLLLLLPTQRKSFLNIHVHSVTLFLSKYLLGLTQFTFSRNTNNLHY